MAAVVKLTRTIDRVPTFWRGLCLLQGDASCPGECGAERDTLYCKRNSRGDTSGEGGAVFRHDPHTAAAVKRETQSHVKGCHLFFLPVSVCVSLVSLFQLFYFSILLGLVLELCTP